MNKEKFFEKLKEGLKEHEIMRDHTTLRAGGVADFYYEAKTIDDLVKAVKISLKANVPYFILGNGSNILFSDYGFPGIVIKNSSSNIAFMAEKSQAIVDSGTPLIKFILEATSHNLSGLEFLYGVPGTVGGAVYGNAGAYGQAIGDFVRYVTLLIPGDDPQIVQEDNNWMDFSYRQSKLKKMDGFRKPVLLSVRLQLSQNRQEEIMRRLNSYKTQRYQNQPLGQSAGCVFKNPIPRELENVTGRGSRNMPELPRERTAGFLLDKAGAKKLKVGSVRVSNKHANFIINKDGKSQEVRTLIEEMRKSVWEKYKINLEEEIEYIGQW